MPHAMPRPDVPTILACPCSGPNQLCRSQPNLSTSKAMPPNQRAIARAIKKATRLSTSKFDLFIFGSESTMGCRQLLGQPDVVEEESHRPVLLVDKRLHVVVPDFVSPVALVGDWESIPGLVLADALAASDRVVVRTAFLMLRRPSECDANQRSVIGTGNVAAKPEPVTVALVIRLIEVGGATIIDLTQDVRHLSLQDRTRSARGSGSFPAPSSGPRHGFRVPPAR